MSTALGGISHLSSCHIPEKAAKPFSALSSSKDIIAMVAGHREPSWARRHQWHCGKQCACARTGRLWHEDVGCGLQRLLISDGVKKKKKKKKRGIGQKRGKMLTCNMYFYYTFLKNRVTVKLLKTLTFFLNRNPYLTVLAFIKFCSLVPGSFIYQLYLF